METLEYTTFECACRVQKFQSVAFFEPLMASSALRDKALGCFYGQAIGDALGARYEFMKSDDVVKKMTTDKGKAGIVPILGGGPFHMAAGQVTDDTEMALALARSLSRLNTVDMHDIASSYHTWYRSGPPDIGSTTRKALSAVKGKSDPKATYDGIVAASKTCQSLSNGCVMRISPLAIAASQWTDDDLLRQVARLDAGLTNPHALTRDAVSVYVTALKSLLNGANPQETHAKAVEVAQTAEIRDHLQAAANQSAFPVKIPALPRAPNSRPIRNEITSADRTSIGYVGLSLQVAFHALLHADSFAESLQAIVALGGDTDTNGCIAGALLGARFGADAIPAQWKESILKAGPPLRYKAYPWACLSDLEELVDKLLVCQKPDPSTLPN